MTRLMNLAIEMLHNISAIFPCVHAMLKMLFSLFLLLINIRNFSLGQVPDSAISWKEMYSSNGIKFSARNAHASCVFKKRLWVVGGRTDSYLDYNLLTNFRKADVWYSYNGGIWAQETLLTGDYFAQNTDVVQPGEIAPFFARAGHTLNAIDISGDGENDIMVMLGGFAPSPSNDMWVTEDGNNWVFCGLAPWSPRAWHVTTVFQGKLWLMGGTPLNNEVWMLQQVRRVPRRHAPLTRSLYNNYTFELDWVRMPDAPWSPRVGMSVVSQWFYDGFKGEVFANTTERIVLVGGYGGFLDEGSDQAKYDGFSCRRDSWATTDGLTWKLLNAENSFSPRAWAAMITYRNADPRLWIRGHIDLPRIPRIYLFGGGYVGFSTTSKKRVSSMDAYSDAYWSEDGITWHQMHYQEGGGSTFVDFYSSEAWSLTTVNSEDTYLGLWGATINSFNISSGDEFPGDLILIGGDYDGAGGFSSKVYRSMPGLFCNVEGVQCSGNGKCQDNGGCLCDPGCEGLICEVDNRVISAGYSHWVQSQIPYFVAAVMLVTFHLTSPSITLLE